MSLSQVEQYQQLEQQYEQARRDYELAESQYHGAAGVKTANPNDPALNAQYEALRQKKARLDELYAELTALRNSLASATEGGPRQAAI